VRKDKAFPFRVAFTVVLVILDFFIIPQLLSMLIHSKHGLLNYSWSVFGGIKALPTVKSIWLWLQPAALGVIAWIWLTGRSLVNVVYDNDQPRPAGHGQHGTARWMTQKEVDKHFSTHNF